MEEVTAMPQLPESAVLLDWSGPCTAEEEQAIARCAEAVECAARDFPEEFYAFARKMFPICPVHNEFLTEHFADSLVSHAGADLPRLLQDTLSADFERGTELLYAVCRCGIRSDALYRTLKTLFREVKDAEGDARKEFYAYILGEYGDGRAIPALRHYAEAVRDALRQDAQSEVLRKRLNNIIHDIARLGGTADDLYRIGLPQA